MKTVITFLTLLYSLTIFSNGITFDQIVKQLSWSDIKFEIKLSLKRDNRSSLDKKIDVYIKDNKKGQNILAIFQAPSNIKGMAFLAQCKKNGDDNWYVYIRTLRRVKKVPVSSRNFMLRDFLSLYLLKPRVEHWKVEKIDNNKIELIAKNSDVISKTGYYKLIHTVDIEKKTIIKTEFYNKKGKLIREQKVLKWKTVDNIYLPIKFSTDDIEEGVKAEIKLNNIKIDTDISNSIFKSRYLKSL